MKDSIPEIIISIKFKSNPEQISSIIKKSSDCHHIFLKLFDEGSIEWKEEAVMLCLNNANKVIGYYRISSGGMTGTVIDPKIIFTVALNCTAKKIVVAHNHPSGSLKPSPADDKLTAQIKAGGLLLDIDVVDHLIITKEGFYSYRDEGLI
jgi:DNA repair protein RadC